MIDMTAAITEGVMAAISKYGRYLSEFWMNLRASRGKGGEGYSTADYAAAIAAAPLWKMGSPRACGSPAQHALCWQQINVSADGWIGDQDDVARDDAADRVAEILEGREEEGAKANEQHHAHEADDSWRRESEGRSIMTSLTTSAVRALAPRTPAFGVRGAAATHGFARSWATSGGWEDRTGVDFAQLIISLQLFTDQPTNTVPAVGVQSNCTHCTAVPIVTLETLVLLYCVCF